MKWKTRNEHTRDGGKSILTPILQIHMAFQLFGTKGDGERIYHERPNDMAACWRLGQNLGLLGHQLMLMSLMSQYHPFSS